MYIKRTVELEADIEKSEGHQFEVGDVIGFTLTDGEEVEAMAMKVEEDGVIFALVDCLADEMPMQRNGKDIMRDYLNKDVYIRFPEEIRNMMKPFERGDMLRLMTQMEVFGEREYDTDIDEEDAEQFAPMKDRRNRIAYQGKDGSESDWESGWWLRDVVDAAYFAGVYGNGCCYYGSASNSVGVRPAFKLSLI